MRGQDPYDPQTVTRLWPAEAQPPSFVAVESRTGELAEKRGIPSPYPPTAFPLLVPFALLPWRVAIALWIGFDTVAFVGVVLGVISLAQIPLKSSEAVLITFAALALAPFHTAIATANIVLIVLALGMAAALNIERRRYIGAGILLSVAIALKPTVALCFFIFSVVRGRWRVAAATVAGLIILFSIADLRMFFAGVHWIGSYLLNTQRMFASGAIDDYTAANRTRFDLLNLQLVFFQVAGSKVWTEILAWLVFLGFLGRWILAGRNRLSRRDQLLDLAILATISLLPFYHRFTDGCLLLPAVAWSITELNGQRKILARIVLILAVPFLVPGAAMLQLLAVNSPGVSVLAKRWWWQLLLAPHQVWMVLFISVLLLAAQRNLIRNGKVKFLDHFGSVQ